jgi:hypothetical protein
MSFADPAIETFSGVHLVNAADCASGAPLYERVQPLLYGGTERGVGCVTDELYGRVIRSHCPTALYRRAAPWSRRRVACSLRFINL